MTSHLPFGRLPSEAWKETSRHAMMSLLPFGRHDDVTPSLRKAPFQSLEGPLATRYDLGRIPRDDVTPSLRKAHFRSLEGYFVTRDDVTPSLRKA
ncbi:unnamed protein product [Prunus armeniaca]